MVATRSVESGPCGTLPTGTLRKYRYQCNAEIPYLRESTMDPGVRTIP